jgi:glycosyltransferase involved in cell wall biosynthesis
MNILLLEPYCGGSHQAWAEGYVAHSSHQVKLLSHSARFWKWRMQGGALTLAERARALRFHPDIILASDMLNLPAFLGLTRHFFADVPVAIYFHENQLTYPFPAGDKRDLTYGMINWLSMLAADRVFFNSTYHMEVWFDELPNLLKHFPDYAHVHRVAEVRAKAQVLPVGCNLHRFDPVPDPIDRAPADLPPLLLWNQRWEYDKDPQTFFRALYMLAIEGFDFRVALAGQSYRQAAPEFESARSRLGDRVVHFGYADDDSYVDILRRADVVISTAVHEFFGIAIVEAVYCGCFPLLPRRLSYLETVKPTYHTACLYDTFEDLLERLRVILTEPERARRLASKLRHTVTRFDWSKMAPRYDEVLESLVVG